MGDAPSSERILTLKICDPAMGSGAFLVETCRFLADQVVLAWTREGRHDLLTGKEDATLVARRLVAQRCLYGVDKNPFAVNLGKLSLWLVTLAKDLPFTFLDHALRHGDSLVGLSLAQITAFHWKPSKQLDLCQKELDATLSEAIAARQRILDLAADPSPGAQKEKEWLLRDAEDALDRIRLIGDLIVGAFFSATKDKEREQERDRRLDLVFAWLKDGGPPPEELAEMRRKLRTQLPPFHWMAEYPEVFWVERPDPLDNEVRNQCAWMDAFISNPPFLGQKYVVPTLGTSYRDWLFESNTGTFGRCDLSAHFLRRTADLIGRHGTVGLVATNTISQGDTRESGLEWLLEHEWAIYDTAGPLRWPGAAAVTVLTVHLARGSTLPVSTILLNGQRATAINSRLEAGVERKASPLGNAHGVCVNGLNTGGNGFVLPFDEGESLLKSQPRLAAVVKPYLGGEDITTTPLQKASRFVIDFGDMEYEAASAWKPALDIVRDRVKPSRDSIAESSAESRLKKYWWQHRRKAAYDLRELNRCLVTAVYSTHLVFCFQGSGTVFNNKVSVFHLETFTSFAVLQSRVHGIWARRLSPTLGAGNTLAYAPTECFETFPFPNSGPLDSSTALDDIGERVYSARAAYMDSNRVGLTQTYNLIIDPDCDDPQINILRSLHVDLDRAVVNIYGWSDIAVPPWQAPADDSEEKALALFEDKVVDHLYALNATRAEEERVRGTAPKTVPEAKSRKGRPRKGVPTSQLALPGGEDST